MLPGPVTRFWHPRRNTAGATRPYPHGPAFDARRGPLGVREHSIQRYSGPGRRHPATPVHRGPPVTLSSSQPSTTARSGPSSSRLASVTQPRTAATPPSGSTTARRCSGRPPSRSEGRVRLRVSRRHDAGGRNSCDYGRDCRGGGSHGRTVATAPAHCGSPGGTMRCQDACFPSATSRGAAARCRRTPVCLLRAGAAGACVRSRFDAARGR